MKLADITALTDLADMSDAGENLAEVGEAVAGAAAEVLPPSLLDKVRDFFGAQLGGLVWRMMIVAVIIMIAIVAARVVNRSFVRAVDRMREKKNPNASVMAFLRYAALAGVYFIAFSGVVAAVPALNTILTTLLTAGGVLAIVAGVAAQEAIGSIASGMMILTFKPFIIGDVLRVPELDITGTVEDITLRHTVLRTFENKRLIIPNNTMNDTIVENFDYGEKRVCLMLDVKITYESDVEKALAVLAEEAGAHPDYLDPRTPEEKAADVPRVKVRVQELSESAVVLRALLWGADNGTAFGMKCDLMRTLKARFDQEGIQFAYTRLQVVQKPSL